MSQKNRRVFLASPYGSLRPIRGGTRVGRRIENNRSGVIERAADGGGYHVLFDGEARSCIVPAHWLQWE